LLASVALAVFGRLIGSRGDSRDAVHLPATWILCSTGVRFSRSGTSCVWLAIRTSRSYLSATNVRLEHIRQLDHACEIISRTVAQLRVMHLGRLFARRSATRIVNGRRATCPTVGSSCPRDTVSGGICTCLGSAALLGFRLPFAGLIPPLQGSGCFHSLETPHARLPPPFISRPFSSGDRRCQLRSLMDATVAGWCGCASGIRFCS
jgi:hypothetical protein